MRFILSRMKSVSFIWILVFLIEFLKFVKSFMLSTI